MRALIAAVSPQMVIGLRGTIPWRHKGDQQRFKRLTQGKTVVMGRLTWESLPRRPLPDRRNVVITSHRLEGVETYRDVETAIEHLDGDVWFIGGARIYEAAMPYCDFIDLTWVPDSITDPEAVKFPDIDPSQWIPGPITQHDDNPLLQLQTFTRRSP